MTAGGSAPRATACRVRRRARRSATPRPDRRRQRPQPHGQPPRQHRRHARRGGRQPQRQNASGALDNTRGRIEAAQNITLASDRPEQHRRHRGRRCAGHRHPQRRRWTTAGARCPAPVRLNLHTGQLTNDGGLIEAADALTIDTHGQTLDNSSAGSIIGQAQRHAHHRRPRQHRRLHRRQR